MKFVEPKENETITMSLERFFGYMGEISFFDDIKNEILKNNSKLTKAQAEKLLDMIRTKDNFAIWAEDPHRVRIIDNGEKDG